MRKRFGRGHARGLIVTNVNVEEHEAIIRSTRTNRVGKCIFEIMPCGYHWRTNTSAAPQLPRLFSTFSTPNLPLSSTLNPYLCHRRHTLIRTHSAIPTATFTLPSRTPLLLRPHMLRQRA